jgi:hypothetical protein
MYHDSISLALRSFFIIIFLAPLLCSCNTSRKNSADQDNYTLLSCGLYRDTAGAIYLKATEVGIVDDSLVKHDVYIGSVWSDAFEPDSNPQSLHRSVDTTTFHSIGHSYYADTNHVYFHFRRADGGSIFIIEEAHQPSFRALTYNYAVDNHHVYYHGEIVEGADAQTFDAPLFAIGKDTVPFYGRDKNHYYDDNDVLSDSAAVQLLNRLREAPGGPLRILSE